MAAPAPAPAHARTAPPGPWIAFDGATLATWTPDPVAGYDEIVRRYPLGGQPLAAWTVVLDRNLGSQPINRRVMLVVHYTHAAVATLASAAIQHAPSDDHGYWIGDYTQRLKPQPDLDRLLVLLRRLRMDQTGWDFVGVVLLLTLAAATDTQPHLTPIQNRNMLVTAVLATAECILLQLINARHSRAMALTWSHAVDLAREWARTGRACGVPFTAPVIGNQQTLERFLARTATFDAAMAWNGPIDRAIAADNRAMLQEAHRAQNELTRPSCPLIADTVGLIAQFLAPAGTSQAALQAQRIAFAASVKTARLQVVAAHAREGARKLAQACLDKDREESAKRQRL